MFQLKVSSKYYTTPIRSIYISSLVARLSIQCLYVALLHEKQKSGEGAYMDVMLRIYCMPRIYGRDNQRKVIVCMLVLYK